MKYGQLENPQLDKFPGSIYRWLSWLIWGFGGSESLSDLHSKEKHAYLCRDVVRDLDLHQGCQS